jgi:dephospho-CoA kinase
MKIIGLTGGIGSGKSTVSAILKELGAAIIDSDKVGHNVLNPGTPGWKEAAAAFGRDILDPQGTIDRKKLAQIVFKNPEALEKLNKIVHPRIDAEIDARLKQYREQGTDVVVVEVALITEARWVPRADQVWVVKTPKDITLKRLKERGMSESESLARMAAQTPAEEKVKRGLVIIDNAGSANDLRAKVEKLWNEIHNEDRGKPNVA